MIADGVLTAFTSHLVLAEFGWTCLSSYDLSRREVADLLQGISEMRHLEIVDSINTPLVLELYSRHAMKLIDAFLAAHQVIQEKNAIMVSYDRDFDKLNVPRREPSFFLQ